MNTHKALKKARRVKARRQREKERNLKAARGAAARKRAGAIYTFRDLQTKD